MLCIMEYYQITKYTHTKTWKWHTFFMFLGNPKIRKQSQWQSQLQ